MKEKIEEICEEYFGLSPSDKWDERVKEAATKQLLSLFSGEIENSMKNIEKIVGKKCARTDIGYQELQKLKEIIEG